MAVVRVCFVFVLIVCFCRVESKPIFLRAICDLFCDDEDSTSTSTSTTTSSSEEYYDWMIDCSTDCRPRRRSTTTPRPGITANQPMGASGSGSQMPISFVFRQPMNVTMQNQGGSWVMSVMSVAAPATPSPVTSGTATSASAASTSAVSTSVASTGAASGDAVATPAESSTTVVVSPTTVTTTSA